jgi:hypothetical protein
LWWPAHYAIKEEARHTISVGDFTDLFSKQTIFLVFHMVQQIDARSTK